MANSFLPTIDMRDELLRLMSKRPPWAIRGKPAVL